MWTLPQGPSGRSVRARAAMIARLAVAAFGVAAGLLTSGAVGTRGLVLAVAYAGVSLAWFWLPRTSTFVVTSVAVDVVCLQVAVYLTGGLSGPGPTLLLLHVMIGMLVDHRRTGPAVAAGHVLFVVAGTASTTLGWVDPPTGQLGSAASLAVLAGGLVGTATMAAWLTRVNQRDLMETQAVLERLAALAERLAGVTTTEQVHAAVLDHVLVGDTTRAALVGVGDGVPVLLASHGTHTDRAAQLRPDGILQRVARHRRTVLAPTVDPAVDDWLWSVMPGATQVAAVPIPAPDTAVVVLVVDRVANDNARVVGLERAADQASLALTSASMHQAMAEYALTDGLTGVANRRALDETLDRELARAGREARPVSLLLVDLDHFKNFNDVHGHTVGDEVLTAIAATMVDRVRPTDLVARYGGEEFAVVLPDAGPARAAAIGERLREAVSNQVLHCGRVTISVGVATADSLRGLDARELLRTADAALYCAKRAGRDRVVVG